MHNWCTAKPSQMLSQAAQVTLEFLAATRDGNNERVLELVKMYPDFDLNSVTDALGNTPLTLAVKNDNAEVRTKKKKREN